MKKSVSKTDALRTALAAMTEDHNLLRKEIARLAGILATRANKGDAQAVISLGLIGVGFAHHFQGLAICDENSGTEHTRPYFEISGYAPGKISGELRNRKQVESIINLGRKWSKQPWQTWDKKRKNVDFSRGVAALAYEAYKLAMKSGRKFKRGPDAFEYGFNKMVENIDGRKNFLELYGPAREIAQNFKGSKTSKSGAPPSVAVQFAEVKNKVKRTFNLLWKE
jgi:hypothetical protein